MRDLNFLNAHIDLKTSIINKYKNAMIATGVFVVILFGVFLWNIYRISNLNNEIAAANAFINSSDNLEKLDKYHEVVNKTNALNKYYLQISDLTQKLDGVDRINSDLVKTIAGLMPEEIFIKEMSISTGSLDIKGVGETRQSIAEFQHNIKQKDIFTEVFIDVITKEVTTKESYSFTLKCGLKGVK